MGKKKQTNANNDAKNKVVNFYGTKPEWVKAELDLRMCDIFGEDKAFKETAVVAEDEKGLYVTGKSYVGAPLLDPYRQYKRVVPEVITEGDVVTYKVNR
jgi:hypothetical protein